MIICTERNMENYQQVGCEAYTKSLTPKRALLALLPTTTLSRDTITKTINLLQEIINETPSNANSFHQTVFLVKQTPH